MSEDTRPHFIRFAEVKRRTAIASYQHARKLAAAGKFPAPVQLGEHAIAWVAAEIDEWIAQRIAERQVAA